MKGLVRTDNKKQDMVNHPNHYAGQGKVECIDFIGTVVCRYPGSLAGDLQNVVKYTWRSHNKNGKEDIEKAGWYYGHAQKTWQNLSEKERLSARSFYMNPIFKPEKAETIHKEGLEEFTKGMTAEEKKLCERIIKGASRFIYGPDRLDGAKALKEYAKLYEKSVEKPVKGIHPVKKGKENTR